MKKIACIVFCLLSFWSCQNKSTESSLYNNKDQRAMYYWKTTFVLNDYEKEFLTEHKINTLYVRLFDVALDSWNDDRLIPIATTRFIDSIPKYVRVVPVVFITNEAISTLTDTIKINEYAHKLFKRIDAMYHYNNLGASIPEIQLDCDWTNTTRNIFFDFCKAVKREISPYNITLCSTIRLHQLSQECPPVDKGVLMLYNTGALRSYEEKNSILEFDDLKNYIRDYDLPLDFAYPTFGWGVRFKNKNYLGLLHKTDFSEYYDLRKIDTNWYQVIYPIKTKEATLSEYEEIRVEQSEYQTIKAVRDLIGKRFDVSNSATILYHLDSANLTNYTYEQIESIF